MKRYWKVCAAMRGSVPGAVALCLVAGSNLAAAKPLLGANALRVQGRGADVGSRTLLDAGEYEHDHEDEEPHEHYDEQPTENEPTGFQSAFGAPGGGGPGGGPGGPRGQAGGGPGDGTPSEYPEGVPVETPVEEPQYYDDDHDHADGEPHDHGDEGPADGGSPVVAATAPVATSATDPDTVADSPTAAVSAAGTLAESAYWGSYVIEDESLGTMLEVEVTGDIREITGNSLPMFSTNFPTPGSNWDLVEQNTSYSIPLEPVSPFRGTAVPAREFGISVGGITFQPGNAQRASCSDGTQLTIEAFNNSDVDFGVDEHGGHTRDQTGLYHYHGLPLTEIENVADPSQDIVHVGFSFDSHYIYYSREGTYTSSYVLSTEPRSGGTCTYSEPDIPEFTLSSTPDGTILEDWVWTEGAGDLDECNGIEINGEYAYFLTDTFPYVPRCLMGEATAGSDAGGGGGGGGGPGGAGGGPGGGPGEAGAPGAGPFAAEGPGEAVGGPGGPGETGAPVAAEGPLGVAEGPESDDAGTRDLDLEADGATTADGEDSAATDVASGAARVFACQTAGAVVSALALLSALA